MDSHSSNPCKYTPDNNLENKWEMEECLIEEGTCTHIYVYTHTCQIINF